LLVFAHDVVVVLPVCVWQAEAKRKKEAEWAALGEEERKLREEEAASTAKHEVRHVCHVHSSCRVLLRECMIVVFVPRLLLMFMSLLLLSLRVQVKKEKMLTSQLKLYGSSNAARGGGRGRGRGRGK
jgi:hypothetical protein